MKQLVEKYAVMCNPEEIVFTPAGLKAFVKAVSTYAINNANIALNTEILKHMEVADDTA